jgi:hypothetical protein
MAQNGSRVPVGLWFLAVPTGGLRKAAEFGDAE